MKPYFYGKINTAFHTSCTFSIGDKVSVLFSSITGTIIKLTHSNHGKGRIHATLFTSEGKKQTFPLGKLKRGNNNAR